MFSVSCRVSNFLLFESLMMLVCTPQPVCPNGEKKVAQYCPKTIGQIIFYMNITLLKIAAKKFQKYLGFFCKKIFTKKFKKVPNLVTLAAADDAWTPH